MKVLNFFVGVLIGIIALAIIQLFVPEPAPIVETRIEFKYATKYVIKYVDKYINVNQTKPVNVLATAYTAGPESTQKKPGMKGYGITRTGTKARPGVCSVDPNYIPLGSSLYVEGYGYCRAEDTGGAIKGYKLDVFIAKLSDANKFGRHTRKIWILSNYE